MNSTKKSKKSKKITIPTRRFKKTLEQQSKRTKYEFYHVLLFYIDYFIYLYKYKFRHINEVLIKTRSIIISDVNKYDTSLSWDSFNKKELFYHTIINEFKSYINEINTNSIFLIYRHCFTFSATQCLSSSRMRKIFIKSSEV